MSKKNIQMQVLGENGYDEIYPVPAGHKASHINGDDKILPSDIGAMDKNIYDSLNRNTDIFTYVDNHATNIPITSNPADNVKIWIDPDEEGEGGGTNIPAQDTEPATGNYWLDTSAEGGTYYTAGEVNELLQNKADLDENGKVPASQLPDMDYAPAYTYGTTDLTAGSSALETGKLYFVYE